VFDVDTGAWAKLCEDHVGVKFNGNSIKDGSDGDKMARLTEHYFRKLLERNGIPFERKGADWELWDLVVYGRRIDNKSKRRNTNPVNYDYHVDASQFNHPCHHYVFSDVFFENKDAADPVYFGYSGWLPKSEFMDISVFKRKGEMDGNFKEIADCRKVKAYQLRKMGCLITKMRRLK
jgi:hypothetical protein